MSSSAPNATEKTLEKFGKLKLADRARLVGDNQAVLDRTNRSEESHRDYSRRVREAQARQVFGEDWEPPAPTAVDGDDKMQIYIDSPVTINGTPEQPPSPEHQPPQPAPPPPATPTQRVPPPQPVAKKPGWILPLALAGALGTGAAIPLAIGALRSDPQPPAAGAAEEIQFPWYDIQPWKPNQ